MYLFEPLYTYTPHVIASHTQDESNHKIIEINCGNIRYEIIHTIFDQKR